MGYGESNIRCLRVSWPLSREHVPGAKARIFNGLLSPGLKSGCISEARTTAKTIRQTAPNDAGTPASDIRRLWRSCIKRDGACTWADKGQEGILTMSIIAFPGPSSLESNVPSTFPTLQTAPEELPGPADRAIRRRGTQEQGRALETLGHSVEYLVDSRLFHSGDHNRHDEQEAVQILMRMSRAVFAECPEVVSLQRRLGRWVADRFAGEKGLRQPG